MNKWLQGSASVARRLNVEPSFQSLTFLTGVAMRKSDLDGEIWALNESDVLSCVSVCACVVFHIEEIESIGICTQPGPCEL